MFNMSTVAPGFKKDKFCKELFNSLAKGYADTLYAAYIYQRKNASSAKLFMATNIAAKERHVSAQ